MASVLCVSPRTIAQDAKFLNLNPTNGDRGLNLYSQQDFNLICQLREHCKDKSNSRESFVPNTEVEIVEPEPQVTKLELKAQNSQLRNVYSESINYGLSQDPLFDLELLQRISDRKWLLPASRLAPLLGISPAHLNRSQKYYYCGFIATKEIYVQKKALWKVSIR